MKDMNANLYFLILGLNIVMYSSRHLYFFK